MTTADRVQRSITIASLVLKAKTKFLGLLKKKIDRERRKRMRGMAFGNLSEEVKAKEREKRQKEHLSRALAVIDKCPRLRDLHIHLKKQLALNMVFKDLS